MVPLTESSEVVSQVRDAGGLDAGEDHLSLRGDCFGVTEALVSMLAREDRSAASIADDGTPVHRCCIEVHGSLLEDIDWLDANCYADSRSRHVTIYDYTTTMVDRSTEVLH